MLVLKVAHPSNMAGSLGSTPLDRGVANTLVGCLEGYMGPSQVVSRLLGIVDDPLSLEGGQAMDMWKQLGYRRVTNRQVRLHKEQCNGAKCEKNNTLLANS